MKTLLIGINAKYIHSSLGIYCLWAYALEHGITDEELEISEYTTNQNMQEVLADIYEKRPDVVAFSCYIWNMEYIGKLAGMLHKIMPQIPVWLGGPEVSFNSSEQLQKYPWATGIIRGEGEKTFLELLLYYRALEKAGRASEREAGDSDIVLPGKIRGITTRRGENPPQPLLSLDELPFPYARLAPELFTHRIIYYETSRGCPYGCSYCLSSVERQVRFRSLDKVKRELQFFLDAGVAQVKFVDRTFNLKPEHTMGIWQYLKEHDNGKTNFHFELSADLLRPEELELLQSLRPGLVQFEIGVQSANPDTMAAIRRNASLPAIRQRVQQVYRGRNIHQHLDLIAGLPYEDFDSFRNSFNQIYAWKPDQLQLGFLKMLRGAPIYYQSEDWDITFMEHPPYEVLRTKWLSYDELCRLKLVEEMVEKYYNSMQFQVSVLWLVRQFETPFDFYLSLGEYYHRRGLLGVQQSRIQNYQILFSFCRESMECMKKEEAEECFRQMLLFDLYARENLKSRPEFLQYPVTEEQKEWERRFYQNTTNQEKYLREYLTEGYDWKQMRRMTYIGRFDYDFPAYLTTERKKQPDRKRCILLFDYRHRDSLGNQAEITYLPEDSGM